MARDQRDTWCQMTRFYGGDIGNIPPYTMHCSAHGYMAIEYINSIEVLGALTSRFYTWSLLTLSLAL